MQYVVYGRRWFQRTYGNTYFSAEGFVDGEKVVDIKFEYGYGDYYLQAVTDELEKKGYLPGREHYNNGAREALRLYADRNGHSVVYKATDVSRKKDL